MTLISPRLPHVLTRTDLALLLLDTYQHAMGVDDDEALERLGRAFSRPELLADFHRAISAALVAKDPQAAPDAVIDKLSKAVQKKRGRVKPAPDDPTIAAVLVRINLELGVAPDSMRSMLESDKGKKALADGMTKLAKYLVGELVK
jgi:hypothetical protein